MKLIKATGQGIVTYLEGVKYDIQETPIEVDDDAADALIVQFGHLIEVTDKPEEQTKPEEQVESSEVKE